MSEQSKKESIKLGNRIKPTKHVVAVMSGKGGVGKTTVAIGLARALGNTTILDADITCPNVHLFLGVSGQFDVDNGKLLPKHVDGIDVISVAFVKGSEGPILWRGPLLSKAIVELLEHSKIDTDYLIVDLPPGTSDACLTVLSTIDLDGVIVVSMPDVVSLNDAKRAILTARKMGVKVLGLVENMAGEIFGVGGAEKLADEMDVQFLGSIPLTKEIHNIEKQKEIFTPIVKKLKLN